MQRRRFLSASAAAAAVLALRAHLAAQAAAAPLRGLPPRDLYDRDEEAYWSQVRELFLIPPDEVYLNNGTCGSSPQPVLQAVLDGYQYAEKLAQDDPEDYPLWGYGPFNEFRDPLAAFVGAQRDQIALVRNCTEANSYIANGLELKAGDEVLMSDQEHPSGEGPWNLRARRYGVVVQKFELPRPPQNAAEILNRINDAITPRTRVIFVSHITTVTGVVLPAKEICALARDKGIISAIDGAHVTGMMKLNLGELGCDLYSSSPHKWLQAPKGSGFLYVHERILERMWSTVTTEGWDEPQLKAQRFQQFGSSNLPILWGLRAAIQLANDLGMERIEKRHRRMADYIHQQMIERGAQSWTSPDPALRCAIATVNVPPIKRMELENWLWKRHKIRIRGGEPSKLRLSTPYYLLRRDIDSFLEKFDEFRRMRA